MKEIESALVVGAGAIGAAVASILFDANNQAVALCAAGERRERYLREGFIVNQKHYSFRIADAAVDGPLLYRAGFCHLRAGDLAEATRLLEKAVATGVDEAPSRAALAETRLSSRDYAGAKADYDRAIALAPFDPTAYYNRGLCRLKIGDDADGALADFRCALLLDPFRVEAEERILELTGETLEVELK